MTLGDTHPKTEEHVEQCPSCQLIDEMDGLTYNPLTPGEWWMIADEIKAETGLATEVEGGGAACAFIRVLLPDGRIILFGDVNEEWTGDVYANAEAESEAEMMEGCSVALDIPTSDHDSAKIARAFREAITDVCIAGNPAILGKCGEPHCICSPELLCQFCGKTIYKDGEVWRHNAPGAMPICNNVPEPKR